ncbi:MULTISPECIES: phosphohistidine phosphatase SixA [unclassified Okeania]|uniref:phosphohistidine phosphatase SixA n=1 Tax=unclassified Okeania TaxID=2634635 RepID=UPI0013B88E61|nr:MULTISPECIES: phosphohistidine phosphatase SixA [unclassified Okeania]NET16667.1 phosphohistidine phosphatase SixA [Okeania sp. SIO1H6]NES78953.1 phosphohistidine phosphatase SixA [Okeania sp. SIO1H4]NET22550.1 phosphohistidine phosphatase SixA [Okeania sp. SIO1H5]NET79467.1 phosphohistidine phosphatase SixA [Okeania sp. SIO1F9]NET95675.1 phosphohistidine phosphatase SixA [Okeania sp. SIO1H2]
MSINVYFIRHGIAADAENYPTDSERPLTEIGDRKTHKIAQQIKKLGLHFNLILTSPLVRAYQTAKILQENKLSSKVEEFLPLAPDGEINIWLKWLKTWQLQENRELALVGHQPDLANWAEILIWGEARQVLILKKAGVIGISLPEVGSPVGNSQMFWLTPPKFLLN